MAAALATLLGLDRLFQADEADGSLDLFLTLRVVIGPSDAALEEFLRGWTPEHPSDPRSGLEGAA
jgi:hypothetical protein